MKRADRLTEILKRLSNRFPSPQTALHHGNTFELLVATVLSAQTSDVHINKVTAELFRKYRSIQDYASSDLEELRHDLRSVNFYRNKARNIKASARRIIDSFHGEVPASMEELVTLPGVGRKTANIILWNGFGISAGIAVDTHVKRLAKRLGLSKHDDPANVERDLMRITPPKDWGNISHYLIFHGRSVCQARRPAHDKCILSDICPSRNL